MSVEQKILILRKRIKELNLKPTGYNGHGKFNYYQLSDFLPHTIDICSEIDYMMNILKMKSIKR